MPRGRSYTGEEMAEIDCHGGIMAVRAVLRVVLQRGARLAGPGEFTLRAFVNGRLSLAEAEAVLEVIRARGERGLEGAVRQLGGELTRRVEDLYERVRAVLAEVEAGIDFPEEVGGAERSRLLSELGGVEGDLRELVAQAEGGRVFREGLMVVLAGRPNAGKSSVLNALLGEDRAIVTAVPGTTRDVLEETLDWEGIPVRLVDTAGIGEAHDEAEAVAVDRAWAAVGRADVVVLVVDGSSWGWWELLEDVPRDRTVVAVNKGDLMGAERREEVLRSLEGWPAVICSAKEGWGLEALKEKVVGLVGSRGIRPGESPLVTRERQRRLLEEALTGIRQAVGGLEEEVPLDCVVVGLSDAGAALGEILGRDVRQEVLEEIFSEFCVGK
jgi:tRNA modification GTPase